MGKYLMLWRMKKEAVPSDPEEYDKLINMLSLMVRQAMEEGVTDWGVFANNEGYAIFEGDFEDLMVGQRLIAPYVEYIDVQQVLNVEDADKVHRESMNVMKAMTPPQ